MLLLKSYGQHFDFLLLKTELSIIYLATFLESNILDLKFQYSINVSHKIIYALLLTIPAASMS